MVLDLLKKVQACFSVCSGVISIFFHENNSGARKQWFLAV
jgi:hypothetical protein